MGKRSGILGECLLLLALAVLLSWGTAQEQTQQNLADKLIRLHVVAASDLEEDQTVKLRVRDAVLAQAETLLKDADSPEEAKAFLMGGIDTLTQAANDTLLSLGSADRAAVTLGKELFGSRYYDGFALPGGYYQALRVVIGAGEGRNWWCVVYPALCASAVTDDMDAVAVSGGFTEEEAGMMEGSAPEYRFKFRSVELFENLMGYFRRISEGIPAYG